MSGIGARERTPPASGECCPSGTELPGLRSGAGREVHGEGLDEGWAGNPFFHPFLWDDIFLFDLEYDDLGRIKTATPVPQDVSRPRRRSASSLTFTWEGRSKRLIAIGGEIREMGTTTSAGSSRRRSPTLRRGTIEYRSEGDTMQLVRVSARTISTTGRAGRSF